jgi:hypothetical protein
MNVVPGKRLRLRAYKIQMIRALKPSDQVARTNFAVDMPERIDASPGFLREVCFSDESNFHVNGVENRYNCCIWGSQNLHVTCELERGNPEVNVWSGLMNDDEDDDNDNHNTIISRNFENVALKCIISCRMEFNRVYGEPKIHGHPCYM